jgi:GNAT superfamily N-acetyltransferase
MGREGYSSLGVEIRPMADADVAASDLLAEAALGMAQRQPGLDEATRAARGQARQRHLLATDPGGCWVAERGGEVVGVALALVREGIWGLSLFAVSEAVRGRGIGRRLLDAALAHGPGARGGIILSSEDPRALRRYARAGFELRPCVAAAGIVRRDGLAGADGVREAGEDGLALADEISRHVRGAAHGDDLRVLLDSGRMLTFEDRGYAIHVDGSIRILAARDDEAAATLLRAALHASPPGATVLVDFITAGHDWAVRTCLDAGLSLSPEGPLFVRGELGPMRPYLPSGAFL